MIFSRVSSWSVCLIIKQKGNADQYKSVVASENCRHHINKMSTGITPILYGYYEAPLMFRKLFTIVSESSIIRCNASTEFFRDNTCLSKHI